MKKEPFSLVSKEKGKEDATSQVNSYKAKKKWNKSEKDMVSTVYFFLCQLLQISFKNVPSLKNLKRSRTLRRKNCYFNARSSNCLLRNTKPGTLYITRALSSLLIFLEVSN